VAVIVIVHGGWDGGWFWKQPARELRKMGHEVYAPTLTGLGERVHLASPLIDLYTHIDDVANVLIYEDLRNVILAGHSYGGAVVSGVAELVPERIAKLVYLDAFLLQDGKSMADLYDSGPVGDIFASLANQYGDGWRVPFPSAEAYDSRISAHPVKTFQTKLSIGNPKAAALPRAYVSCTGRGNNPVLAPLQECAARAKAAGWEFYEMETNHNLHVGALADTVRLLNRISGGTRT
jgi:pimeloyl-ACP methyl ester carboxylesterase